MPTFRFKFTIFGKRYATNIEAKDRKEADVKFYQLVMKNTEVLLVDEQPRQDVSEADFTNFFTGLFKK